MLSMRRRTQGKPPPRKKSMPHNVRSMHIPRRLGKMRFMRTRNPLCIRPRIPKEFEAKWLEKRMCLRATALRRGKPVPNPQLRQWTTTVYQGIRRKRPPRKPEKSQRQKPLPSKIEGLRFWRYFFLEKLIKLKKTKMIEVLRTW